MYIYVYRQITIYFQQHQKDQLSELFNTKLEMHHCWVSFFLEIITKTLSLPAQRTRISVGRLGTVIFLVRDKQNSLHERNYSHLLSNSTQSANRSSSKCLHLLCGRQEEEKTDMLMIPFTALLLPVPLTHAGVSANKCCKDILLFIFFFPPRKDHLLPLGICLFQILISGLPYLPCFPPKKKMRG